MTESEIDSRPCYLIFGATGGIGEALSRRLAAGGCRLMLAARNSERLSVLADQLQAAPYPIDARSFDEVDACVEKATQLNGRLDGVANCVGSLLLKSAHLTTEAEWLETIATNLTTAFAVVRASAKAMTASGGSIVLVSSAAARIGLPNHEAIAAAKAGVIGLTLSAAASYGPKGIRINCVAPGLVRTPMTARLTSSEATLKASTSMHALGRIGEPTDVQGNRASRSRIDYCMLKRSGKPHGFGAGISRVASNGVKSCHQPLLKQLPVTLKKLQTLV